jgi:hypothetical protein
VCGDLKPQMGPVCLLMHRAQCNLALMGRRSFDRRTCSADPTSCAHFDAAERHIARRPFHSQTIGSNKLLFLWRD